jgi:hypothetical protein
MSWIDLPTVKAYLRKTTAADDAMLTKYIGAACSAIELIKRHVDPVDVAGEIQTASRRGIVILDERPVIEITSVSRIVGAGTLVQPVPQFDLDAGVLDGWRLQSVGGVLAVPRSGDYVIAYTAGRDPVPDNIVEAALELVAHLWRTTQLNPGGGRPQVGDTDQLVIPGLANALPYRVRELLGLFGKQLRDEVFLA